MDAKLTKEEMFKKLTFGNLIYAKRLSDTSKKEEGHKNGPFLVIGRKEEYLVCCMQLVRITILLLNYLMIIIVFAKKLILLLVFN